MAKFLSDRQQSLKVGISSYTENNTVLQTIGRVGIGTTNANGRSLYVIGNVGITGVSTLGVTTTTNLTAQTLNVSGISTLQSTTLIGGGTSTGTANQVLQVTGGAYVSGNIGIGTTNPSRLLDANGDVRLRGAIYDSGNSSGGLNEVLSSNGSGVWSWKTVNAVGGANIAIANDTTNESRFLVFTNISSGSTATEYVSTTGLVFNPSSGNLGIGSTLPTSKLDVIGNARVSGVSTLGTVQISSGIVTATTGIVTYYGDGSKLTGITASSIVGVTSYATNAGIATNLKGGVAGNVPYQSAPDTTVFVTNGSPNQVLLFNGTVPVWGNVSAAAGAFGGISVQDDNTPVGTSNSITTLNFKGANIIATATTGPNGIATITVADNLVGTALSISGISTFSNTLNATNIVGTALSISTGISTLGVTGVTNLTAQQLNVSGISTLQSTTLIGGGTSTGTANQVLQVTGGAYVSGNIGIGTTNPTSKLSVEGDVRVSGVVTATTFNGQVNATNIVGTSLSVATGISTLGVTTVTNLTAQQLNVSGVSTLTTLNATNIVGTSLSVATGIATIGTLNFTTATGSNIVGTALSISTGISTLGVTTTTNLTARQLNVSGISTLQSTTLIGGGTSTGTANQVLQVTGGAYISTNTGIGTINPLQNLHVQGNVLVAAGSSTGQHITQKPYELNSGTLSWEGTAGQLFSITNNLTSGSIFSVNDVSGIPSIDVNANGTIQLGAYGGNIGVGTTSPATKLHVFENNTGTTPVMRIQNTVTSAATNAILLELFYSGDADISGAGTSAHYIRFRDNNNNPTGAISGATATTVFYNTTSDYRLKEDVAPFTNGIEKIMQLKPCEFTWKCTQTRSEGFIAHEVQEIIPGAVFGAKDAVNEDGDIEPQMIDPSKMVVHLTAALQEAVKRIEYLESIVGISS